MAESGLDAYKKLAEDPRNCVLEWTYDEKQDKLPMVELVPLAQQLWNAYVKKRRTAPHLSDNDIRSLIVNENMALEKVRRGYSSDRNSIFNVLTDRTRPHYYVEDTFHLMDLRRRAEEGSLTEDGVGAGFVARVKKRMEDAGEKE